MSMPLRCNSQITSTRSHSMIARWTSGNDTRRRSRQGGKSRAGAPSTWRLQALLIFQPGQETIGQHHCHRMAVEALPHSPLMLIPAQLSFRFFMILLDPAAPMLVFHHLHRWCARRAITPIIMVLARWRATGTFAQQPPDVPRPIPIHAPAAHGGELRFEGRPVAVAPGDDLPGAGALLRDEGAGVLRDVSCAPSGGDLKVFAHRRHTALAARFQPIEKVRVVAIVASGHDTRKRHACRPRFVHQVERDLCLGLKLERGRHMRFGTAGRIVRPGARQVETRRHGPGQRALGIVTIDRHLTIADFPQRPRILARHADRGRAFFHEARVINNQHPIAFTRQLQHRRYALPIERLLVPDQIGEQLLQVLLRRAGHDLGHGVAVLVRMLSEQSGQITFEAGQTRSQSELEPEGSEKGRQLRQGVTRCLRQSFKLFHTAILTILLP